MNFRTYRTGRIGTLSDRGWRATTCTVSCMCVLRAGHVLREHKRFNMRQTSTGLVVSLDDIPRYSRCCSYSMYCIYSMYVKYHSVQETQRPKGHQTPQETAVLYVLRYDPLPRRQRCRASRCLTNQPVCTSCPAQDSRKYDGERKETKRSESEGEIEQ